MKTMKKIIPISAEIASALLRCIFDSCRDILADPECMKLFEQFREYIDELINSDIEGDITDEYIVIEHRLKR